jgi:putative inorganic carbon (hco3(-)) transporter
VRLERIPQAMAWCAFATVCLGPFAFGAVERSLWIPLCELWLALGLASAMLSSRSGSGNQDSSGASVSRALLPCHFLFALQLLPMPAALLDALSPGSFAAHFVPSPGDGRFRSLSVSPSATLEAWLYFAGLQGLFLALQGLPRSTRPGLVRALLGVILFLAAIGLWQSRSSHPYWPYGRVPVTLPPGLDTAVFGPYLNRNHFATVMAMGAGLAAGLAARLVIDRGGLRRLISAPTTLAWGILLAGASACLVVASAASGSRSGLLASLGALAVIVARTFGRRLFLVFLGLGISSLLLTGAAAIERLMHLDLLASRWTPWTDMTTLFRFFPIFGSGLGTFAVAYWPYQRNATYEFWQNAHNDYLQFLIETGVAGVLALGLVARRLKATVDLEPETREAAIGAFIAFGTQALLDFPLRIPANAAIIVCIMALTLARRE